MEIEKVGVLGCGLMGHGIAQICAQAGWTVVVREVDQDKLDAGLAKIDKQLGRARREGQARAGRRRRASAGGSRARSTTPTSPTATW